MLLRMEANLDKLIQPERYPISAASSIINRTVMIRAKPLSLMANYSKIKEIEPLWSHVGTTMEGS